MAAVPDAPPELPVYLDCAATTPPDPRVVEVVYHYLATDFGNAASHTHVYGSRANKAVEHAREAVAAVAGAKADEVYFTSGATEANNLAIQGLAEAAREAGRTHIVSTAIEHKAVLEPLERLVEEGFEVTYVAPTEGGWVQAEDVLNAVRDDTFVVSIMHVNNETGVIQPLRAIADGLADHPAYLHTDASQGFGKEAQELTPRVDLISASAHKLYGPKGVGALIARRRRFKRPPVKPLLVGGGQERGLRSGTLPVHLCAGFGKACEIMLDERVAWAHRCGEMEAELRATLEPFEPQVNGEPDRKLPCILNVSFGALDSEAVMVGLKDAAAISNGSACTTAGTDPSHVLESMGLDTLRIQAATRWSWSHLTPDIPSLAIGEALRHLQ